MQEVGGQAAEDQKQMRTSSWWINQRGGLINFLRLKRRGLLQRGDLFERGVFGGGGDLVEDLQYLKAQ